MELLVNHVICFCLPVLANSAVSFHTRFVVLNLIMLFTLKLFYDEFFEKVCVFLSLDVENQAFINVVPCKRVALVITTQTLRHLPEQGGVGLSENVRAEGTTVRSQPTFAR